jgi:AcrR family transcriptional regulator
MKSDHTASSRIFQHLMKKKTDNRHGQGRAGRRASSTTNDTNTSGGQGRAGRRAGSSTTRADILAAARARFGEHGYAATTIRQIARDAGVDPAFVHYFFGSKDALFGAVMELPYSPAEAIGPALAEGLDGAGPRLARRFLEVWEDPEAQAGLLALLRSAAAHPDSARNLRDFVAGELRPRVAKAVGTPDADLRAVMVGSALLGMVFERYILAVEPLASADHETVVSWLGPTLQRYLTGAPGDPPG